MKADVRRLFEKRRKGSDTKGGGVSLPENGRWRGKPALSRKRGRTFSKKEGGGGTKGERGREDKHPARPAGGRVDQNGAGIQRKSLSIREK